MGRLYVLLAVNIALAFGLSAAAQDSTKSVPLRNGKSKCGYYLTSRHETSNGMLLSEGLDPKGFETELAKRVEELGREEAFPETHRISVVGAPRKKAAREELVDELRTALVRMGYEADAEIETIRATADWIADVRGFYVESRSGQWRKISGSSLEEIRQAAAEGRIPRDADFLIVGRPIVGVSGAETRTRLEDVLDEAGLEPHGIRTRSEFKAGALKAIRHPFGYVGHMASLVRDLFPYKEQYQEPTPEEARSALRKTVTPGLINGVVLGLLGKPIFSVLIPTVLINGMNSYYKGKYESFYRRWITQTPAAAGRFIKQLMLSTFFATDIYFLGDVRHMAEMISFAGWWNYLSTKWVSILFQTLWRTPVENAVANWANNKISEETDPLQRTRVRNSAANVMKLNAYAMTPAFIHSLFMHPEEAWIQILSGTGGLQLVTDAARFASTTGSSDGSSLLMAFGPGHLGMLAAATVGTIGLMKPALITPYAKLANWVDRVETGFLRCLGNTCQTAVSWFKLGKTKN